MAKDRITKTKTSTKLTCLPDKRTSKSSYKNSSNLLQLSSVRHHRGSERDFFLATSVASDVGGHNNYSNNEHFRKRSFRQFYMAILHDRDMNILHFTQHMNMYMHTCAYGDRYRYRYWIQCSPLTQLLSVQK